MWWEDKLDLDKELDKIKLDDEGNVVLDKEESSLYKDFITRYNFLSSKAYTYRSIHNNTRDIWKLDLPLTDLIPKIYDSHMMNNVPPYVIRLISDENLKKFNEDIRAYLSSFVFIFQYIHYQPNRDVNLALSKEARNQREQIYNENRWRKQSNRNLGTSYDKVDSSWVNQAKQDFRQNLKENHPKIKFSTTQGESKFIEYDFLWYLWVVIRSEVTWEWSEYPRDFFFKNEAFYKNTQKQEFTETVFRRLKKFFNLLESKYLNVLEETIYFDEEEQKANNTTSSSLIEQLNRNILELQRPWELQQLDNKIEWIEEEEEQFEDLDLDGLFK